ncbi:MAG: hypothetical protein IPK17_21885 [Chloroflexi bacterium]|uniref:WD40 repeat domain-containing protein n=1 Tax=Candidatus Flexifilum breve TaxID=3140694 RepID=UPI00313723FA|nr:hypothetical protein [Chloroflexota bacterium]
MSSDGLRLIVPYSDIAMYDPVDSSFQVWNLETDTFIEVNFIGERNPIFPYFSPTGHLFAVRTSDRLSVFDGDTGIEISYWEGRFGSMVWFNSSGHLMAFVDITNFTERFLVIWDVEHQQEIKRIPIGDSNVSDLSFSPDGMYVAYLASHDLFKCGIVNNEIGDCVTHFHSDDPIFLFMMITTNSRKIFLDAVRQIVILDAVDAEPLEMVDVFPQYAYMIYLQQIGDVIAVLLNDQPVLLNVLSRETVPIVNEYSLFNPDLSMYVLSSGDDPYAVESNIELYSTESNVLLAEFTVTNLAGIYFSPNDDYILAEKTTGEIEFWGVPAN